MRVQVSRGCVHFIGMNVLVVFACESLHVHSFRFIPVLSSGLGDLD